MFLKNLFGTISTIFTVLQLIPQIHFTIKTKKTKDLSILYIFTRQITHISWITYGIIDNFNIYIIITDVSCLILTTLLLLLKIKYDNRIPSLSPKNLSIIISP